MQRRIVKHEVLRQFLRLGNGRLSAWCSAGYIVKCEGGYCVASVNNFLRMCARGFGEAVPTFDDLRSGRLVLLRSLEVEAKFGISQDELYRLRQSDKVHIAYLKFPGKLGSIRYRQSDILRLTPKTGAYTAKEVGRIIGRSVNVVRRLVRQGKLERIHTSKAADFIYISEKSLLLLLREWLPVWISPEDWLDDCQASIAPLVPLCEVSERLGRCPDAALELLKQQRALFITGPYKTGQTMVSPIWLAAYEERTTPLNAEDVARLYGVSMSSFWRWRGLGLIKCPIAGHSHGPESFLFQACWIAILKASCSPGYQTQIARFVSTRLGPGVSRDKLINQNEAAVILNRHYLEVERLAQSGELRGIRTPGGMWMFSKRRVRELQQRLIT